MSLRINKRRCEKRRKKKGGDARRVLVIGKDALGVALDGDGKAGVHERLGGRGGEGSTVLERLGLATEPELMPVSKSWVVSA